MEREQSLETRLEDASIDERFFMNGLTCKPCGLPYQQWNDVYTCPEHKTNCVHAGCGKHAEYCVVLGCNERLVPLLSQTLGEDISRNVRQTLQGDSGFLKHIHSIHTILAQYTRVICTAFALLATGSGAYFFIENLAQHNTRIKEDVKQAKIKADQRSGGIGIFFNRKEKRYIVFDSGMASFFKLKSGWLDSPVPLWCEEFSSGYCSILSFDPDLQQFFIVSYARGKFLDEPYNLLIFDTNGRKIIDKKPIDMYSIRELAPHFEKDIVKGTTLLSEKNPQD